MTTEFRSMFGEVVDRMARLPDPFSVSIQWGNNLHLYMENGKWQIYSANKTYPQELVLATLEDPPPLDVPSARSVDALLVAEQSKPIGAPPDTVREDGLRVQALAHALSLKIKERNMGRDYPFAQREPTLEEVVAAAEKFLGFLRGEPEKSPYWRGAPFPKAQDY